MDAYEYIVNISKDFITLINRDYVYEIVNDSYCTEIGQSREEIINRSVAEIWGKEKFENSLKRYLNQCFEGQEVHYIDTFKFGPFEKYMHVSYYPYRENDEITHVAVFSHDITSVGEIESKLTNYEYRDPVTGLFNRRSLDVVLDKEIEKAKRSKYEKLRAVLFVSLENLAKVNQVYGHEIGDLLLENSGLRIRRTLRRSDYVFRFAGSELSVILTNIAKNTDAGKVAQKIYNNVAVPYRFKETDINITCHIGIALYPEDGADKRTIVQKATSALAEAKKRNMDFLLFDASLHEQAVSRLKLESEIAKAFEKGQFELHYQPVVDTNGKIHGAEALIRWNHPERGYIPPMDFIPIAEETGLIIPIGRWALFTACRQISAWMKKHKLYVSINLSAKEFSDSTLLEAIQKAIKQSQDFDPAYLKLEITETKCMDDPEKTIKQMQSLLDIGVETFIDDFGTGYSSLGYLKRLPAVTLKIDKLFIDALVESQEEQDYLTHIIRTVKSRKKKVLVEGVSSREQFELLKAMACDQMQGYLFSRPVPAEEFEKLLARGTLL
ncbi:MAG: EAL domain-containing protein [Spirochaetales bacterium]|nr:EAL domain-containing protein [Spirochaetales bacterium]